MTESHRATEPVEPLRNARPGGTGQSRGARAPRTEPPSDSAHPANLWPGDTGSLSAPARRALALLVRGPHLSAAGDDAAWRDLLTHADALRTRLADMYLDLVLDHDEQVAYVRNADVSDGSDAPSVVREMPLTFTDTVLLLHLRTLLLEAPGGQVVVGLDSVVDHLRQFRLRSNPDGGGLDGAGFDGGVAAGWRRLVAAGILLPVRGDGSPGEHPDDAERHCVISPVLRTLFGAEEIQAVRTEYARLSREAL